MYILFVCLFFFFFLKKRIPKIFFQKTPVGHVYFYTRVQQNATCNLYTRPIVSTPHMATWPAKHAAIWPRGHSNRYCRHAAIFSVFCSEKRSITIEPKCPQNQTIIWFHNKEIQKEKSITMESKCPKNQTITLVHYKKIQKE